MVDVKTGCLRFRSLLNEGHSVLLQLLQNVVLLKKLDRFLVPTKLNHLTAVGAEG